MEDAGDHLEKWGTGRRGHNLCWLTSPCWPYRRGHDTLHLPQIITRSHTFPNRKGNNDIPTLSPRIQPCSILGVSLILWTRKVFISMYYVGTVWGRGTICSLQIDFTPIKKALSVHIYRCFNYDSLCPRGSCIEHIHVHTSRRELVWIFSVLPPVRTLEKQVNWHWLFIYTQCWLGWRWCRWCFASPFI